MKQTLASLLLLTLISCGENQDKKPIDKFDVIIEAQNLNYDELSDLEKESIIFSRCCCYPHNWNQGINCVEKENAFYVKAKINNKLLANLSESETFDKDKLLNENPHFLYGKYHNRWKFIGQSGSEICETSKFEGHHDFMLIRNDTIDEVIIGPLPTKPKRMIIEIIESKYYMGITPEAEIEN